MLVKVHNLNVHPYREKFREKLIEIEPAGYVEMDEDEAEYFLQTFTFPKKDSQGRPDPIYFKKLKIEKEKVEKPVDTLICHANGQKAATVEDLNRLVVGFSNMLASKDEEGEAEVVRKQNKDLRKENKELKTRLELIEEKLGIGVTADAASI